MPLPADLTLDVTCRAHTKNTDSREQLGQHHKGGGGTNERTSKTCRVENKNMSSTQRGELGHTCTSESTQQYTSFPPHSHVYPSIYRNLPWVNNVLPVVCTVDASEDPQSTMLRIAENKTGGPFLAF